MSLPPHLPNGTVPQVVPELASGEIEAMEAKAGKEMDVEKARQLCQLSDRRIMETKQELDRIEQMGKVHRLLHQHIAAKIGRNLEAKFLNYGPLGKDRSDTNLTSPLTSPKQIPPPPPIRVQIDGSSRGDSSGKRSVNDRRRMGLKRTKKDWIVGRQNLGELSPSFEESQKKELEDIKGMQIVKTHLANRRRARSLANRMFNARVNNSRTKTSILLTGSEPDQEEMVKAMRHMNRFVIEKFLQTQSQNRRVLDRLNSIQMKTISDIKVGKAQTRKGEQIRRRSDSSVHEAMIVEEAEEREKEEERKGVKRPYKRASMSSFSHLLSKTGVTLKTKVEHGVKKITHHSSPKRYSLKTSYPRDASKHKKKKGSRRLRWNRAEREKIQSYADEDEILSKSSGTDEIDSASSPMYGSGITLEPLMEKAALAIPPTATTPKDQESAESDRTISPMSSSGGVFLAFSSGSPPTPPLPRFALRSRQEDHDALTDQIVPTSTASMAVSPPQSPPTQQLTDSFAPPTSTAPIKGSVDLFAAVLPKQATPTKCVHVSPPASRSVQAPPTSQQTPPATPQTPPTLTSPVPPVPPQAPPPLLLKSAPPPPPPFQAHGIPSTPPSLNTSTISSTARPRNIQTDSPSVEDGFGAALALGTPAGYQADTEFQFEDLSQEKSSVAGFFKPFPPLHAQLSNVSSEESMHETPSKRARIEEELDNNYGNNESAEFDDFQALPILQPQYIVEESAKTYSVVEERYSQTRDEAQVVPMLVEAGGVQRIRSIVDDQYDMDDTSERDEAASERDRRPVMSTRRVVHEQASISDQDELEVEDEKMEVTKERGSSSNFQEMPKTPKNLSSRKSSSLENRQGSSDNNAAAQAPPRAKRHFSTPTISMDIDSRPQIRPSFKPKASANRAYYTPIEIDEEFNPFNYEFEQDPSEVPKSKGRSSSGSDKRVESDSAGVPLSQRTPRVKPHRYDSSCSPQTSPGQPQCRTAEMKRKTIPPSAYDDPAFRKYLKTVSHPPTYDDYLSFRVVRRLVVIGDDIEVRYKDKINNALDNIYMDIMKKTFSFENFSMIANRLLLESRRMQDRVFMIPLLARRLKEEVTPQMASAVGNYTEMFMDNFVTKYLMSMGGWETIVESYKDIEVHDEHPNNYIGDGGANVGFGDGEELVHGYVYHLQEGGATNYDHLYDGGVGPGVHFANHVNPPPFQNHGRNMNEIDRVPLLDTYEDNWPPPKEKEEAPLTKEDIFLSYLALHHPFLADKPDYLRRVNSVEVLFQENTDPSDDDPDIISSNEVDGNPTNHNNRLRRKRSSQISLARSLSADSLASPGFGSGAFSMSPTASTTFLSRRISRSASRNPAPPAESPTKLKRAFSPPLPHPYSSHPPSPIMEHIDYPTIQDPPQSSIISTSVSKGSHSQTRPPSISILVPNPANPIQHPVSIAPTLTPPPSSPVRVPSSQVSVCTTPSSSLPPYYQGQSSGETYEHLYESDPSRSNSAAISDTGSHGSKSNSESTKKSNGVHHQTKTNGKTKEIRSEVRVGPPKWVVPVAIVTVGVALIAGYFYMKRKS